jgi:hypothetical protein
MTLVFLAALIATPGDRLAAFIAKRQPKAKPYASLLAQRIIVEGKRHGLKPHWLATVAWVESDFNLRVDGKAGEYGIFQVMRRESGIGDAWDWLRSHPKGFPLAAKWGAMPWRKLRRRQVKVLRSIPSGTYIAAAMIARHVALCRRLGHRIGRFRCKSAFINRCKRRYHPHAIDRVGHWNSGWRWPKAVYLRKLRRRSKIIRRVMARKGGGNAI